MSFNFLASVLSGPRWTDYFSSACCSEERVGADFLDAGIYAVVKLVSLLVGYQRGNGPAAGAQLGYQT